MKRYINFYLALVRMNFYLLANNRYDAANGFVAATGWGSLTIVSILLLTSRAKNVLGWTQPELLLLTGAYSVMIGIFHLFFSRSLREFPSIINYGQLDGYLLKPIDAQFLVSFLHIRFMSLVRVALGIGFCWYIIASYHIAVSFLSVLSFILLSFCGAVVMYAIWFLTATILIWHPQLSNILELANNLSAFSRYPPQMYHELNFFIFLFLLPMTLIVATPVRFLVLHASLQDSLLLLLVTIILFITSRLFWLYGLRHYTSASS